MRGQATVPHDYLSVPVVQLKMVKEKTVRYSLDPITTPGDILSLIKPMFKDSYREMVVIVGINSCNSPTGIHVISYGSLDQASIYTSSIAKFLLLSNSRAGILIHNHPSSTLIPSAADTSATSKLKDALKVLDIELLDHLIVDAACFRFYSFRNENRI